MAEGDIGLDLPQDLPAFHVGEMMSSVIAAGLKRRISDCASEPAAGDEALEAAVARDLEQHIGKAWIVFDNQQHTVVDHDSAAVILGIGPDRRPAR